MKTVCIIGEGAWGTAVATVLVHNGYRVNLWCHDAAAAENITATRINQRYLPGVVLNERIVPMTDLSQALCGVQWVFEAIPVKYLRAVLKRAQSCFNPHQIWVILSKGIEQDTLLLPTQIINDVAQQTVQQIIFAGPSFAREVAQREVTAVTIAASNLEIAGQLQRMINNEYFSTILSADVMGTQVAGAVKNVIALGSGILKGAGCGDNTQAFLITRGLQEMAQLAQILGGAQDTIYGLAGVGDLVLTAMGKSSRNLEVGIRLGKGESLESILQFTGYTPEGINTVQSIHQLMHRKNSVLPVCESIYQVVFNGAPQETIHTALLR